MNNFITKDINTFLEEEIDDLLEHFWKGQRYIISRAESKSIYKLFGLAYTNRSRYEKEVKHIEFICVFSSLLNGDYTFVIEKGFTKTCVLDRSKVGVLHFIESEIYPYHVDIEPILEFIESYPCKNPVLLIGKSLLWDTNLVESIICITNFEETDELCEYLKGYYISLSIPQSEALKDIYELYKD